MCWILSCYKRTALCIRNKVTELRIREDRGSNPDMQINYSETDFRSSQRRVLRWLSSGTFRHAVWYKLTYDGIALMTEKVWNSERRSISARLHVAASQKTVIFIFYDLLWCFQYLQSNSGTRIYKDNRATQSFRFTSRSWFYFIFLNLNMKQHPSVSIMTTAWRRE
jgi:hypothetical protein